MPSVNRTTLKGYFNLGDVPTESNFVDLIDSAVNQAEDNLTKEANGPLRIGYGTNQDTLQKVIEFYRGAVGSGGGAWSIGLTGATGRQGFSIFQSANLRLIINELGRVGIGTDNPTSRLQVNGDIRASADVRLGGALVIDHDGLNKNMIINSTSITFPSDIGGGENDSAWIRYFARNGEALTLEIGTSDNPNDHIALMPSGGVGIGTREPKSKLHVAGGDLMLGNDVNGQRFLLHTRSHANADSFQITIDDNNGDWHWDKGLVMDRSGNVRISGLNVRDNGNVGIGATNPRSKLDIWGGDLNVTGNSLNGTAIVTTKDGIAYFANNDINNGISIEPSGLVTIGERVNVGGLGGVFLNWPAPDGRRFSMFGQNINMVGHLILNQGDFTELFEAENKTTIPIATAVILTEEGLIRPATLEEVPMGVISVAPAIICNNALEWPHKHLKNEFGQILTEEVEEETTTPEGKIERKKIAKPIFNPAYDPNREYIPRNQRPEWHPVGLLGQLHLRKGQPVASTWVKIRDVSENVELWLVK